MKNHKAFIGGVILLVNVFLFTSPLVALAAAKECMCFCGTLTGAEQVSEMTSVACSNTCRDRGDSVASCAFSMEQYPGQNPRCFNEDTCVAYKGALGDDQPEECLAGMRYCYPDPELMDSTDYELQVSIGGTTTISDLGHYIQIVYQWVLGASVVIAIIFVMIGGAQYVLSAGGASNVASAKKRMTNAAVGLILLMSVHLILVTVNPQLVKLEVAQIPLVQSIDYLATTSCEYLYGHIISDMNKPYTIANGMTIDSPYAESGVDAYEVVYDYGKSTCGNFGEVVEDPSGSELPAGTTCPFEYCPDSDTGDVQRCYGSGSGAKCIACRDVYPENISVNGVMPSSETCGQLARTSTDTEKNYCFYSHSPYIILSGDELTNIGLLGTGAAVASVATFGMSVGGFAGIVGAVHGPDIYTGTCAEMSFNCSEIKRCSDYEDIDVVNGETDTKLDYLESSLASDVTIGSICSDDPCKDYRTADAGESCVIYENDNCTTELSIEADASAPSAPATVTGPI
jgi:hypothetical protein